MRRNQSLLHAGLVFAVIMSAVSNAVVAEEIRWSTDIEQSLKIAGSRGTPLLMEFTAAWCGYCKKMELTTFRDPVLAERINRQFIPVRIDADVHPDLVKQLQIKGLPAILIVAPDLEIISTISGFQTAEALTKRLDQLPRGAADAAPAVAAAPAAQAPAPFAAAAVPAAGADFAAPEAPAFEEVVAPAAAGRPGVARLAAGPSADQLPRVDLFQGIPEAQAPARPSPNIAAADTFADNPFAQVSPDSSADVFAPTGSPAADPFADAESAESPNNPFADSENPFRQSSMSSGDSGSRTDSLHSVSNSDLNTGHAAGSAAPAQPGQAPPAATPAFRGVCLVSAVEQREIVTGSSRFTTTYRNRVLYFQSADHRDRFLASPDKYWPMLDGICSVTLAETGRRISGEVRYAAVFRKRVWFFTSEECMREFLEDPAEMVEEALEQL